MFSKHRIHVIHFDQKLDGLQQHISAMRISCDEAETQLRLTNEASTALLERAGSLQEERLVG